MVAGVRTQRSGQVQAGTPALITEMINYPIGVFIDNAQKTSSISG